MVKAVHKTFFKPELVIGNRTGNPKAVLATAHAVFQEGAESRCKPEPHSFARALFLEGAEEKMLTPAWMANSLRWVMWKLKSLADQIPSLSEKLLSHDLVLDEMKKRSVSSLCKANVTRHLYST